MMENKKDSCNKNDVLNLLMRNKYTHSLDDITILLPFTKKTKTLGRRMNDKQHLLIYSIT